MTILVIGGGLSGLALANMLEASGQDYLLVEASGRFGGRIITYHQGAGYFDMGPTWFWAGQPRIASLIARLGLEKFEQFFGGMLTYEDERGKVERERGFASMQGSWRLKGGLGALTQALAEHLPSARKRLNSEVGALAKSGDSILATLTNGDVLHAGNVVLALPPRIAEKLSYAPTLPTAATKVMRDIPTWMAGQAKAVAVYDTAFWRDAGLSGDAMSRHGPMVEIHDASPAEHGPYALFGFIGVPAEARTDEHSLRLQLLAQFERLFGPQAAKPIHLYVKDWAYDPLISTPADKSPLYAHPTYELPMALQGLWGNTLHFSGTEVAPEFGGYLEGALEAAENTFDLLTAKPVNCSLKL